MLQVCNGLIKLPIVYFDWRIMTYWQIVAGSGDGFPMNNGIKKVAPISTLRLSKSHKAESVQWSVLCLRDRLILNCGMLYIFISIEWYQCKYLIYSQFSQLSPSNSSGHIHSYPASNDSSREQTPLFWQGCDRHAPPQDLKKKD